MSTIFDGFPASEGIGEGQILRLDWGVPVVEHQSIPEGGVEAESDRFRDALEWAADRLRELQRRTEERLGEVEARIFEPQMLMLEDPEVVDGTLRYISENRLGAPRAFHWRMLELRDRWNRTSHPMVLDRLNDLEDLMIRVLNRLLDLSDPTELLVAEEPVIVVARNLTPSMTVHLDGGLVRGIATDLGTRTAHWAILARSLEIPAVVGLGHASESCEVGAPAILDGRMGRLVVNPTDGEKASFADRNRQLARWEESVAEVAALEATTLDGHTISLRANLDLPDEATQAAEHGAVGVGLYRTEFLVVGRASMPTEEEQYQAYKTVAEAFPTGGVCIRTFDLGGDKFPVFLEMPSEENPFLGWRAIRVCLDRPDLFRVQLRAFLRATAHGDVRLMLPLVNDVEEIRQVRALLTEEGAKLAEEGIPFNRGYKLGVMIETPAAALDAAELARDSDFLSIGTNDLVQYTLAVDRTNPRLAKLYNPFHPAVVRQLHQVARVGRAAGIEVSVCGELASHPLGAFLLIGLDIPALSMSWPSLPEIKKVIRDVRIEDARQAARKALAASTGEAVIGCLVDGLVGSIDLSTFSGRWSLSLPH